MKFALFRHWRGFGHVILGSLHWAHIHLSCHRLYRRCWFTLSAPSWYIILTMLHVLSFPPTEFLWWLHVTNHLSFDDVSIQGTYGVFLQYSFVSLIHLFSRSCGVAEALHMECNFGPTVYLTEHTQKNLSLSPPFRGSQKCRLHRAYTSTRAQTNKLKQRKYF